MKYIPVLTVILTFFVLAYATMFKERVTVKHGVVLPPHASGNIELTDSKQIIEYSSNGDITIK